MPRKHRISGSGYQNTPILASFMDGIEIDIDRLENLSKDKKEKKDSSN